MKAKKEKKRAALRGDLVQIHKVILRPEQRSGELPESTKASPYEAWIKGSLLNERAHLGDTVRIKTSIGRELEGELVEINPSYRHDFGKPRPELSPIGKEERERLARKRAEK